MTLIERRDLEAAATREAAWLRHCLRWSCDGEADRPARLRQLGVTRLASVWLPEEFDHEAWQRLRGEG